jgi:two-component system, OmpR family, sensor kinase
MIGSASLALFCNLQGEISEVLQNSLEKDIPVRPGMPFARLAARGSLSKALSFLASINAAGTALDWEINIQVGEDVITMHFIGGKMGRQILVAGADNRYSAAQLFEETRRKNNGTITAVGDVYKEIERDDDMYNEISRLNNELVAMQRELAKKNAELTRLNELKNQFLGMAAHDLRNPLQGILSCAEFLIDETAGKLDPSQAGFLSLIRDQSKYMSNLVNDLLDVTAIESGKLQLELQPVDLVLLAQTNLARNRLIAARKNITLDFQADPIPPALLDASKIEQVFDNLLTNAIKFSPTGAHVQMAISLSGEKILLRVHNPGTGISPEQISHLFQPFQRGRKGTAGEKSIGLGLTIVKRIVEGHGGKIWLESQPGIGTTFFVSLPSQLER